MRDEGRPLNIHKCRRRQRSECDASKDKPEEQLLLLRSTILPTKYIDETASEMKSTGRVKAHER